MASIISGSVEAVVAGGRRTSTVRRMSRRSSDTGEDDAMRSIIARRASEAAIMAGGGAPGEIPPKLVDGMRALLRTHTPQELQFLADELGVGGGGDDGETKLEGEALMDAIFAERLGTEAAYVEVLEAVWEGIIIEYWRGLGKGIKTYKHDLRKIVYAYWTQERDDLYGRPALVSRRAAAAGQAQQQVTVVARRDHTEFVPVYTDTRSYATTALKLEQRAAENTEDKVQDVVATVRGLEAAMAHAQRALRLDRSLSALMQFLRAVRALGGAYAHTLRARTHILTVATRLGYRSCCSRNPRQYDVCVGARNAGQGPPRLRDVYP